MRNKKNEPSNVQMTVKRGLFNHQRPETGVKIRTLTLLILEILEMFQELRQNLFFFCSVFPFAIKIMFKLNPN